MRTKRLDNSGFTLLELILVMAIVTMVAAMVVPSLGPTTVARKTKDYANLVVALADFARTEAVFEARIYRLNIDPSAGAVWLTADDGTGKFQPPTSDYGKRFDAPPGVRIEATVTVQANMQALFPPTVQQQIIPQPAPISGQTTGATGYLVQNLRGAGTPYVEFDPTGRADPATLRVTDLLGTKVEVACDSPTERFHVVAPGKTTP